MASGIQRTASNGKYVSDNRLYINAEGNAFNGESGDRIRLEDPGTYEITPKMKDQFFQQMNDGNRPVSGIRSMLNSEKSQSSSNKSSPPQVKLTVGNSVSSRRDQNPLKNTIRKEHGINESISFRTPQQYDPFVHSRGKHTHLQNLLVRKASGSPHYLSENFKKYEASFSTGNQHGNFGPAPRRINRPEDLKLVKTESSPANMVIPSGLGYLSKLNASPSPIRSSNFQSSRINPLISNLILDGTKESVGYPEICKCRKTFAGACEIAEDWKTYIIKRPLDLNYLKNTYNSILKRRRNNEDTIQIDKDVPRTYPELDVYLPDTSSTRKLTNILNAVAIHFPKLGYIQGMNFIAASLIYHIQEEDLTFWVFAHLVEFLNLHELYKPGINELIKVSQASSITLHNSPFS